MLMNLHHFDLLARGLATAGDRRSVLRTVASIAAFALTGLHRSVVAQEGCLEACAEGEVCTGGVCSTPCENHRDCRSKHDDPCVSNTCLQGLCVTTIIDCLPGHECCKGECCPTSCASDVDCTVFDPCWWGRCGVSGQCEFTEMDPCHVCATDLDCVNSEQNTVCCNGGCRRPCPVGTLIGKGCECHANGSAAVDGVVVVDDASG